MRTMLGNRLTLLPSMKAPEMRQLLKVCEDKKAAATVTDGCTAGGPVHGECDRGDPLLGKLPVASKVDVRHLLRLIVHRSLALVR